MGLITIDHIKAFYEDSRYLSARIVHKIHLETKFDKAPIAAGILVAYLVLIILSPQLLANGFLVLYPITLKCLYPLEVPPSAEFIVYWACYGLSTLVDISIPNMGAALYYLLKLGIFLLFVLQPFCLAEKIAYRLPRAVDYVINTANDTVKSFDDNVNKSLRKKL